MAAHLHRYCSELKSLKDTANAVISQHSIIVGSTLGVSHPGFRAVEDNLKQIHSQIKAVMEFELELEKKIKNNLALLFNRIQLSNDRLMVANGAAMQGIMQASREETKVSRLLATKAHKLSESMKEDSLSMRTIAACTMLFLPGTSFAAILSMPFFDNSLKDSSRIWVWVILTVPSTMVAFAYYFWRQSRNNAKSGASVEMTTMTV
ncbi:uncharacterized protein KY384_002217 [Bacidia gigantensis]|uniref:uncharacterized protein n=1 Tax=Bacidia gigantensis TaxID=2732470 RepID=UPI001D043D8E|nr:uncharacterized protein KY384_002217 [Bacidia gigantensis]KAG8533434.1 hypothetical protein KY384_002217 [Bacidia gigantensis]